MNADRQTPEKERPEDAACHIDLTHPDLSVKSGHLKMGGRNGQGCEINASNRYLTLGGQPWLPVMGEFHFSRYPRDLWELELRKMRAGGITIASSYIFWIHHEEIEGELDFSGNRDLRHFVELCFRCGLLCYPRLGPWVHGEARNGGLPDWVLAKCGKAVRRDAEPYLTFVRRLYGQIAEQLAGLLWKDGGPVVGVQLDNELVARPDHLLTLKTIARQAGIDVPLYTMTGWGGAQPPRDEIIPLFGGYPDAAWDRQVDHWARELSAKHYFFLLERDDTTIGADLRKAPDAADASLLAGYPYGTCELGGGMEVSYHRRPIIEADDVAALAMVKVGCGCNLQGYYMYHGGSHPLGELSTMQESQATGYPNDMPVIDYDYQAPLGAFAQRRESYHALRVLHMFLNDFGGLLAPMAVVLPEVTPSGVDDRATLRWAARTDGQSGFVFLNNYHRIESLADRPGVQLKLKLACETLVLPQQPVRIASGAYMIWPFHMDLCGVRLRYATAQALCRIDDGDEPCFVFFAPRGTEAEFAFDDRTLRAVEGPLGQRTESPGAVVLRGLKAGTDCLLTLRAQDGRKVKLLLLSEELARRCWKATIWDRQRLFLSAAGLVFDGQTLRVQSRDPSDMSFAVFPPPNEAQGWHGLLAKPCGHEDGVSTAGQASRGTPQVAIGPTADGVFARYDLSLPAKDIRPTWRRVKAAEPSQPVKIGPKNVAQAPDDADFQRAGHWEIHLPAGALDGAHEVFLRIRYAGDVARAYLGDRLIADDFYYRQPWEVGLKRFAPEILRTPLTIRILPLRKDAPIYIPQDRLPDFGPFGEIAELLDVQAAAEYEVLVLCRT